MLLHYSLLNYTAPVSPCWIKNKPYKWVTQSKHHS